MLAAKHPQTPRQRKARAGRAACEHHSDNGNRQFFPTRKKLAPINDASLYIKYNRTLFVLDNSKIVLAVDYRSVRSQLASVPRSFPQQAFLESWPFRKYHGKNQRGERTVCHHLKIPSHFLFVQEHADVVIGVLLHLVSLKHHSPYERCLVNLIFIVFPQCGRVHVVDTARGKHHASDKYQ